MESLQSYESHLEFLTAKDRGHAVDIVDGTRDDSRADG